MYLRYIPFNLENKIEFSILTGIYFSRLIHESYNYQQIIPEKILLMNAGKWYSNNDLGIVTGLELNYRLNKSFLLSMGLTGEFGLVKIYSDDPWGYISSLKDSKNIVLGIRLGITVDIPL